MKKTLFFLGVVILGIAISSAISNAGNEGYFVGGSSKGLEGLKLDLDRINTGSFAQKGEKRIAVRRVVKPAETPQIRLSAANRAIAAANRAIDATKRALAEANRRIRKANSLGARMRELELREKPYVVVNGDSLWKIAESIYGDGSLWKRVFNANRDKVRNSSLIYPGQILDIP